MNNKMENQKQIIAEAKRNKFYIGNCSFGTLGDNFCEVKDLKQCYFLSVGGIFPNCSKYQSLNGGRE